jgi:acyl-CoA synthetase (AMP-forming)/AMP-acid ligase II
MKMRNINYFDKELSVEEYVKKEVCKNAGTQSVAFKEQLISLCSSAGIECNEKMKKEELFDLLCNNGMTAIGRPFEGIDALIMDNDGRPLPTGETGELWISGNQVMGGYWNAPEKNGECLVETANGKVYYKTGDLCRMDADGDIIYCGRKDSQIKIQGFRIELSEIEHVAKNFFNGECRVVVIPKYDNGNQCELHLVVEKKQLDKQQMEEYLYSRLPYYMIPKHMHCLEQFPLNTSSKTDRKKIQELI